MAQKIYKLVCKEDPQKLGIEDQEGNWNLLKLEQHIHQCDPCADFMAAILEILASKMNKEEE
jgi:hypothetical protein